MRLKCRKGLKLRTSCKCSRGVAVVVTGDDDDAVAVGDEVAAGRVAINKGLTPHANEEEALVTRVDETEHGDGHPKREKNGRGEPHHDPKPEVILGAHFF